MGTKWLNPVYLISLKSKHEFIFFALVKIKATNYQDASSMIWLHKQNISTKKNSERNRG